MSWQTFKCSIQTKSGSGFFSEATIDNATNPSGRFVSNGIGSGSCLVPETDPNIAEVIRGRFAYCYINDSLAPAGLPLTVCFFIIQKIQRTIRKKDGVMMLQISGAGIFHELSYRNIGLNVISDGLTPPGPSATDIADILAYGPPDWTSSSNTASGTYHVGAGETIFKMLQNAREQSGEYFRFAQQNPPTRLITWLTAPDSSGATLIMPADPSVDEADNTKGMILSFTETEGQDRENVTRIQIRGAGIGNTALLITLAETEVTLPAGISASWPDSILIHDTAELSNPRIDKNVTFANVQPEDATTDAETTAAVTLYNTALEYLIQSQVEAKTYRITCTIHRNLKPLQNITVNWTDPISGWSINESLIIQDVRTSLNKAGAMIQTLTVSNQAAWKPVTAASSTLKQQGSHTDQLRHSNPAKAGGGNPTIDHGALTGLLDVVDHPDYLLEDGTRPLTGNLGVDPGITIDGVDISVHAVDADAHHNWPLLDGDIPSNMVRDSRLINTGDGLSGGGDLSADRTLVVDLDVTSLLQFVSGELSLDSSSNPGAAAKLLKTNASGLLGTEGLRVGAASLTGTDMLRLEGSTSNIVVTTSGTSIGFSGSGDRYFRADDTGGQIIIRTNGTPSNVMKFGSNGDITFHGSLYNSVWEKASNQFSLVNGGGGELLLLEENIRQITAGDLTLRSDTEDVILRAENGAVQLYTNTDISGQDWVDGSIGWGVTYAGHADFRDITADTLTIQNFISDLSIVQAGSLIVTSSMAVLSRDFTIPATTTTIYVYDLPGNPDVGVFITGDYIMMKYVDRSTGLVVGEAWGTVTTYANLANGEQSWLFTKVSGTTSDVIYTGSTVLDFGSSGDGYWEATAVGANPPHTHISTWVTDPSVPGNHTEQVRIGNLGTDGYGIKSGKVLINPAGIKVEIDTAYSDDRSYNLVNSGGTVTSQVRGIESGGSHGAQLRVNHITGKDSYADIYAYAEGTDNSIIKLIAQGNTYTSQISLDTNLEFIIIDPSLGFLGNGEVRIYGESRFYYDAEFNGNVQIDKILHMYDGNGSVFYNITPSSDDTAYNTDKGIQIRPQSNPLSGDNLFRVLSSGGGERLRVEHDGEVYMNNDLRVGIDSYVLGDRISTKAATDYTGYIYVPLQDFINPTNFTSLTSSDVTGTLINLPSAVPADAKAIQVSVAMDADTVGATFSLGADNDNNASRFHFSVECTNTSAWARGNGIIAIKSTVDRRIYRLHDANGGTIATVSWVITGYFI